MEKQIDVPNCSNCGARLVEKRTKNNRRIFACPNWNFAGTGCLGTIYDPHQEEERKRIFPRVVIRHNVASRSEKGKFRTVEVYENGDMRCNCFAGDMSKFCHHQKETGKWLKELLKKIEVENKVDFNTIELKEKKKCKTISMVDQNQSKEH
jgi:hypothetical protein